MSRIIIHQRKSGKYDYTIRCAKSIGPGDDVNENILVATVQGFERKKEAADNLQAVYEALLEWNTAEMTHAQYAEFMRKHRNQLARNRRARKVKK